MEVSGGFPEVLEAGFEMGGFGGFVSMSFPVATIWVLYGSKMGYQWFHNNNGHIQYLAQAQPVDGCKIHFAQS